MPLPPPRYIVYRLHTISDDQRQSQQGGPTPCASFPVLNPLPLGARHVNHLPRPARCPRSPRRSPARGGVRPCTSAHRGSGYRWVGQEGTCAGTTGPREASAHGTRDTTAARAHQGAGQQSRTIHEDRGDGAGTHEHSEGSSRSSSSGMGNGESLRWPLHWRRQQGQQQQRQPAAAVEAAAGSAAAAATVAAIVAAAE